ncbi:RxLR effector protein [Phytophthora megakarya]|uniref:RxLR effector protein n=1 Tax=Phytophthora megakarya TaxID=4795 RepID=A0A225WDX2_9STRA|nr:RxLR effector protein [Phytophthora megakarya]
MYTLLKNSNSKSRLVNLVHSMRQFPETKTFADKLQFSMYSQSRSMRKAVEKLWIRSRVSPEEAFKILQIEHSLFDKSILFHPWLRYTELFRRKHGVDSFTDVQLLEFLLNRMKRPEPQLGIVLQTLKSEGFENLGERLQKLLFRRWITSTETPQAFGDLLVNPYGLWSNLLVLPKTDARFKTLEGYTLQYAEEVKGKAVQESAKKIKKCLTMANLKMRLHSL